MGVPEVQSIAKPFVPDVEPCGKCILQGSVASNGAKMAYCVFDCSGRLLDAETDLETYQDALLGARFYESDHDLRFNFYLFVVCDEAAYSQGIESGRVAEIEDNRSFARKLVVTEEQLPDVLQAYLGPANRVAPISEVDIVSLWEDRFEQIRLGSILDELVSATAAVDSFLGGSGAGGGHRRLPDELAGAEPLSFIRRIHLKEYRDCLSGEAFDFGLVNLITGENGSGKTSVLEGLEQWVCGRTRRNYDSIEQVQIGLQFDEGMVWSSSVSSEEMRGRSRSWYGAAWPATGRNPLPYSFAQHNFDTDAAVRLMIGPVSRKKAEKQSASDLLARLVLGERAGVLEDRVRTAEGVLQSRKREAEGLAEEASSRYEEVKRNLTTLEKKSKTRKQLWPRLVSGLSELGLPEPAQNDDWLDDFDGRLTAVLAMYVEAEEWGSELLSSSLEEVEVDLAAVTTALDAVAPLKARRKTVLDRVTRVRGLRDRSETDAKVAKRVARYYQTPWGRRIHHLDAIVQRRRQRVAALQRASDELVQASLGSLGKLDLTASQLHKRVEETIGLARSRLEDAEACVSSMRNNMTRRAQLLMDLRQLGEEIAHDSPDMSDCPLCGASYDSSEELSAHMKSERKTQLPPGNTKVQQMEREAQRLRDAVATAESTRDAVSHLIMALSLLPRRLVTPSHSLGFAAQRLSSLGERLKSAEHRLCHLEAQQSQLASEGLSAEDYLELASTLQERLLLDCHPSRDDTGRAIERYAEHDARCRDLSNRLQAQLEALNESVSRITADSGVLSFGSEPLGVLRERRDELAQAEKLAASSCRVGGFPKTLSLSRMHATLSSAKSLLGEYRTDNAAVAAANVQRAELQDELDSLQKKQDAYSLRLARLELGLTATSDVLTGELSASRQSRGFIEQNEKAISSLFKALAVPREFDAVRFEGMDVRLVRARGGGSCSLSEVSSGQRVALAISVFLALNANLRQGPPYLLFDDAIAHVDDLNSLTFMDYVRSIALVGTRQIFFATANAKVADLFRHKFRSLGPERFVEIPLQRSPTSVMR